MSVWGFIVFAVVGALAGYLARFLMPGRDPMGCIGTMVLGMVGSFVGGSLATLIFADEFELTPSGFIGSVIGAMIVLLIIRMTRR
ncbi:MAG: GlsB/YeaQ/YmgE family stress response membrane protein [Nitriliruptorales bacterium]|nr:GlsB/YeaQ/YmgE family stress response membrane protein [Nitriliruptorales bacterium]